MKRPRQPYDLVEVVWADACGLEHGWKDKLDADDREPMFIISVGFLVERTRDTLILAQDTHEDGGHNTRGQIPVGVVRRIKVLRKKDASGKE